MEIIQYDEIRAKMDEVKEMCNFIPDVTTDEGYTKSKRVSFDVGKILTGLEKTRKELKADSLAFGRKVDAEAKAIAAELEEFRLPHKEAYKELDNLKKEREKQRKETLENRVRDMREIPELMRDSDSDGVKMALEKINTEECLDFYEYTEQALKARNSSKELLSSMFAEKLKQEQEAAELAKLRKEQEDREKKEREERIAKEAAEKATLEAEAEAAAERQRIEDEKRREQEEIEKRKANKRHVGEIRKAAKESLMESADIDEESAKRVVLAISKGLISNVVINY